MEAIKSLPNLATTLADGLVLILLLTMVFVVIFACIRSLTSRSSRVGCPPAPINPERDQCLRAAGRWSPRRAGSGDPGSDGHISIGQRPPR